MQLEQKRIEGLIHYWVILEELKKRHEQLADRQLAMSAAIYDSYLRTPKHCAENRREI